MMIVQRIPLYALCLLGVECLRRTSVRKHLRDVSKSDGYTHIAPHHWALFVECAAQQPMTCGHSPALPFMCGCAFGVSCVKETPGGTHPKFDKPYGYCMFVAPPHLRCQEPSPVYRIASIS
jgi:hypothetical protein